MNNLAAFKQRVHQYAGLTLEGQPAEERLLRSLQQSCQRLGMNEHQLLQHLQQSTCEMDALISELTVNETYFFREPEQIRLLTDKLLPQLFELASERPIRILSAGCSSGEEPYSLAIAILERLGAAALDRVQIDAGDVDIGILARARRALYSSFSFRGVPDSIRTTYFTKTGNGYQLHDSIRHRVNFFSLNLMAEKYSFNQAPYDVIFFRNVSIYFDLETRQAIQRSFREIMQPEAILFLGTTETLGNDFGTFELCEQDGLYYFSRTRLFCPNPPPLAPAPRIDTVARALPTQPLTPAAEPATEQPVARPPLPKPELIRQLLQEERYTEASGKLELLLYAEPDSLPGRLMQAWLQINTGQLGSGAQLLDAILEQDPWQLDALLARGLCHKWQNALQDAGHCFKAACYAHADSWLAQYYHGDCLRHSAAPETARGPLQIVRRILSGNPEADSGCQWLPLAPPAQSILFLVERQLLGLKPGRPLQVGGR